MVESIGDQSERELDHHRRCRRFRRSARMCRAGNMAGLTDRGFQPGLPTRDGSLLVRPCSCWVVRYRSCNGGVFGSRCALLILIVLDSCSLVGPYAGGCPKRR